MKTTALLIVIALSLVCIGPSPQARAVCQQGCDYRDTTFLGEDVLLNNVGYGNTAIGFNALFDNIWGEHNTATGAFALFRNTSGNYNTANGGKALSWNTTGFDNTANGADALANNSTGFYNTATGSLALVSNGTGSSNTANGVDALFSNRTGSFNTATGSGALVSNNGDGNTATGIDALHYNTSGSFNTAHGPQALFSNTTGDENTAIGDVALVHNTTGHSNIALGFQAGANLTTGDNNIDIGALGVAAEANTIRIGTQGTQTRTFIAGIVGAVVNGRPVMINPNGQLGAFPCSARYKDEIKPMDAASEVILALEPVSFRYKWEIDPDRTPQFGLVAEQVEKVDPALVARDADGKPYTVRYEAVNAMLLNEFLKEHRKNEKQEATIAELRQEIAVLTSGLQKVSAELEASKLGLRTASNNQ